MTDNDKIIAMTRSLAKAIQMDERYIAVKTAREHNSDNKALQDEIGRFNLARFNLNAELGKEKSDDAKVSVFNQEVQEAYEAITKNEGMAAYYDAKEVIDKLVSYIQAIVTGTINGVDPDDIDEPSACSGSCDTCGGCG
ncbi:MAG: YlbF family regulator [Oscillospiraceae bacterium]